MTDNSDKLSPPCRAALGGFNIIVIDGTPVLAHRKPIMGLFELFGAGPGGPLRVAAGLQLGGSLTQALVARRVSGARLTEGAVSAAGATVSVTPAPLAWWC